MSYTLKGEDIEILMDKFAAIPPEQFTTKEIDCIHDITKYSNRSSNYQVKTVKLFWEIATQVRSYPKGIIEVALDKFCDMIKSWDREQKGEYIVLCIQNLE